MKEMRSSKAVLARVTIDQFAGSYTTSPMNLEKYFTPVGQSEVGNTLANTD